VPVSIDDQVTMVLSVAVSLEGVSAGMVTAHSVHL
jgi:hypothetical protein